MLFTSPFSFNPPSYYTQRAKIQFDSSFAFCIFQYLLVCGLGVCPNYWIYWVHNWAKCLHTDKYCKKNTYWSNINIVKTIQHPHWSNISLSVSLSPSVLKHLHTWKTSTYQPQHYKYSCSARSDHFVCSCSSLPLPLWLLMECFCVHLNGLFLCCWPQILFLQECSMSSPCSDKKPAAKPPPCDFECINLTSPGLISLGNGSDFTQMTPGHFT